MGSLAVAFRYGGLLNALVNLAFLKAPSLHVISVLTLTVCKDTAFTCKNIQLLHFYCFLIQTVVLGACNEGGVKSFAVWDLCS